MLRLQAFGKALVSTHTKRKNFSSAGSEWRKKQLEKLERKFKEPAVEVNADDELQPMWKEMEGRVRGRKPRTAAQNNGKTGRRNIKKTDEDVWLEKGLYDEKSGGEK